MHWEVQCSIKLTGVQTLTFKPKYQTPCLAGIPQMPSGNDIVPPRRRRTPNFMTYPYPTDGECTRIMGHLEGVKSETRRYVHRVVDDTRP